MRPRSSSLAVRSVAVVVAAMLTAGTGIMGALPPAHAGPPPAPEKDTVVGQGRPGTASKKPEEKLTAKLRDVLEKKPEADFWVRFTDQPDLAAAAEIDDWAERGRYVVDALRAAAAASQADVVARLDAEDVDYESYWAANAVLVEGGDVELAQELAADAEVTAITETTTFALDEPVETEPAAASAGEDAEWGVEAIGAPEVWAQGITGEGITVANLDTGVDVTHPALAASYRGTLPDGTVTGDYSWFEPGSYCGGVPCDSADHGTHTMGTMVGDAEGNHIGVAPGAEWIASDALSYASDASMLAAAQWFLAPTRTDGTAADPAQRPHIINNSWGKGGLANSSVMPEVLSAWAAAGIFDVWSNGNDGPLCETTGRPGGIAGAYSVGAHDADREIARFSSRGTGPEGTVKPDIAAPGVDVRSAQPGGGYQLMSGTSMAAPHVAGAVALLWSAAPSLVGDIDATRTLLDDTAHDVDDTSCGGTADDNSVWGEGTLDVAALIAAAPTESATIEGTLLGADGGALDGATLTVGDGDTARSWAPDGEGRFTLRVAPGDHTVTARAPGYLPATSSVTVAKGGTARLDLTLALSPLYTLTGTVQDSTGERIAGATVTVSAPGAPTLSATADEEGAFVLADVPVGSYTLQAGGDRCTEALTERVDVASDLVHDLTLERRRDATGYTCTLGTAGARAGETPLTFTDELATADLPFTFPFYGADYDEITVSDNGWLSFLPQSYATYFPFPIPNELSNPHAAVFAYLNAFVLDESSGVYTAATTVDGAEAFVVEWRNVRLSWAEARTTFSATLYADGRVELGYGPNTDPVWLGGAHTTIGLENATGTEAFQYAYSVPGAVREGLSVMFARPAWGRVTGTVTNALDHLPVADVEVRLVPAGGGTARSMWTGADGAYALAAPPGEYDLSIAQQHFERVTERVVIAEDAQVVNLSPALRTGAAVVLGGQWDWRLLQGQSGTTDLTLWNFGTAPLSASVGTMVPLSTLDGPPSPVSSDTVSLSPPAVSKPGAERPPSSRGVALGQIYASTEFPVGVGLDPDGELWVSDAYVSTGRNLRYSRAGTLLGEHDARVGASDLLRALTWDTTIDAMCQSVYQAGSGTSVIRCYDDEQKPVHELTGAWSDYSAYGLAHDPARDVFYVAVPELGEIVTVAGTTHATPGELLARCTPESRDPVGLAFNPTSGTLWMSSNWAERAFIQLDPADCRTLRTVAAPAGVIDGAVYDLETDVTGALWAMDNATHRVRLVDVGDPLVTPVSWVSADPGTVTLDPMVNTPVKLTIDTAGLAPGTYTTDVAVASTAGRAPVSRFTLTLEVVAPYTAAVDVGGPGLTDAGGVVWSPDRALPAEPLPDGEPTWGWTGASDVGTTKKAIDGTDDDALFRTVRTGDVAYTFRDVPAGSFDVGLGLVELQPNPKAGKQVVDVLVNGQVVVEGLDVAAEAGGLTALTRTVTVEHDGGDLEVALRPRTGDRTPGLATLRLAQRSLG